MGDVLNFAICRYKGSTLQTRTGKLAWYVAVYSVWHETNKRVFEIRCSTVCVVLNIYQKKYLAIVHTTRTVYGVQPRLYWV